MSIWSVCKDYFKNHVNVGGILLTAVVGFLFYSDRTRQATAWYIGMHNRIDYSSNTARGIETREMYTASLKDNYTIAALIVPVFAIFCTIYDIVSTYRPAKAGSCYLYYLVSGLVLLTCFVLDVIEVFIQGYWTAFPLWWNGLPQGHMSFNLKLYYLVQSAMLVFYLMLLGRSKHAQTTMLDRSIDGVLNLVLSIICYTMNFVPLMMIVIPIRFGIQVALSFVQVISILEVLGKSRDFARTVLRAVRWLTVGEMMFYVTLILTNLIYGHRGIYEQTFVHVPLFAMLLVSGYRVLHANKYDIDQLRAGDNAQGGGAAQAAAVAAPTKSKSKSRK